jgi:hypothetical protein
MVLQMFLPKTFAKAKAKKSAIPCRDSTTPTCLGHLGQHDTNRNNPISVASPKVGKASWAAQLQSGAVDIFAKCSLLM